MTTKVVIDTDPGTDDALALIMAMNSPELEVCGLTTVGGNARLSDTTRNALRLLAHLGRSDIPVHPGASRPLRGRFSYGYDYHGPRGLPVRLATTSAIPNAETAPDYIVATAASSPGDLVLVALGPLTNMARAIQQEPRMVSWIKNLVVMGGAVEAEGNVTPFAEFNIYNDPHAANAVFDSGVTVTLVGLDVCNQVAFGRHDSDWKYGDATGGVLAASVLSTWFEQTHPDLDVYPLCDPLAMAEVVIPDTLQTRPARVRVEDRDVEQYGRTRATYGEGNVNVALGVDVNTARALILQRLMA